MAQYKSGLVSVTNGSKTVTSQANTTFWAANVSPGDIFTIVGDNVWYEVASLVSDEILTLATEYSGVTQTNTTYTITRDFTPNYSFPYPLKGDIETASVLRRALLDIDKTLGNMIDVKDSVVVGTTTSIANLAAGPTSIDGVTLALNDRVLIKDTASIDGVEALSAKRNGLYYVFSLNGSPATSTTFKRTDDASTDAQVTSGMFTFIEEGTTNNDSGWILTTENPIVVDTTDLTFSQFTGTGLINAGIALTKTGNTLDVDLGTTAATAAYGNHNHTGGGGSLLDADLVDGLHASQFIRSDVADAVAGILTISNHLDIGSAYSLRWGTGGSRISGNTSSNILQMFTNNTEAMRIDTNGNVGIGISAPVASLDATNDSTAANLIDTDILYDVAGSQLRAYNTNDAANWSGISFRTRASNASAWTIVNEWKNNYLGDLVFRSRDGASSSAERMRIDSSGNVGIGRTNPLERLDVGNYSAGFAGKKHYTNTVVVGFGGVGTGVNITLNNEHGTTLNTTYHYKISLTTIGTSTDNGSSYIAYYMNSTWYIRAIGESGNTINHPLLAISGSNLIAYTNHTSNGYTIRYSVESSYRQNIENNLQSLGADSHWQRFDADLFYTDGNVGIGISNPERDLHIKSSSSLNVALIEYTGATNSLLSFRDSNSAANNTVRIGSAGNDFVIHTNTSGAGSERFRVDSSGNVGIGIDTPLDTLQVFGGILCNSNMDTVSTGGLGLKLGQMSSPVSNSTNTYVGHHNTGGPGGSAGDLLLIPRTSIAGSLRVMTGTPTPVVTFKVDANGAITKPKQPAFMAYKTVDQNNIATSTTTTISFNGERFDQGANFNTTSSIFTAPVAGKYQFNVSFRISAVDTAAAYYQVFIRTSNAIYEWVVSPNFSADVTRLPVTISHLTDMDIGDSAWVTIYQSGGTAQSDITQSDLAGASAIFSGYLVA